MKKLNLLKFKIYIKRKKTKLRIYKFMNKDYCTHKTRDEKSTINMINDALNYKYSSIQHDPKDDKILIEVPELNKLMVLYLNPYYFLNINTTYKFRVDISNRVGTYLADRILKETTRRRDEKINQYVENASHNMENIAKSFKIELKKLNNQHNKINK